jgi:dihydroorotase
VDALTFRSGVTTVVDAGSSGWKNFPDFKSKIIDHVQTRVLALVNIVSRGMEDRQVQQDIREMDPVKTAACARQYPDTIVGIKTAHFVGPEWNALEGAVEAGRLANIPAMIDYGGGHPNRPFSEALKKMRPGDMYTHFYGEPRPLMDDEGRILPYFTEARKRGIIFDVGHGAGSLLFRQAVPAIRQGFVPDSISTDVHTGSMNAGMKDMLNVMSKFLNMGMSLADVVRCSTWNPAREIHRTELGNLSEGSVADVAVLRVQRGNFGFVDAHGARLRGNQKLEAELTISDGAVVWDLNGITRDDWQTLGKNYALQGDPSWDGTLVARPRKKPGK